MLFHFQPFNFMTALHFNENDRRWFILIHFVHGILCLIYEIPKKLRRKCHRLHVWFDLTTIVEQNYYNLFVKRFQVNKTIVRRIIYPEIINPMKKSFQASKKVTRCIIVGPSIHPSVADEFLWRRRHVSGRRQTFFISHRWAFYLWSFSTLAKTE